AAGLRERRVRQPPRAVSHGLLHQVDGRTHRRSEWRLEGQGTVGDLQHQSALPRRRGQRDHEQGREVPAPSRSARSVKRTELRFSAELFEFLRELRKNNNREWFLEHKARYESLVREPLLRFIAEVGRGCARSAVTSKAARCSASTVTSDSRGTRARTRPTPPRIFPTPPATRMCTRLDSTCISSRATASPPPASGIPP